VQLAGNGRSCFLCRIHSQRRNGALHLERNRSSPRSHDQSDNRPVKRNSHDRGNVHDHRHRDRFHRRKRQAGNERSEPSRAAMKHLALIALLCLVACSHSTPPPPPPPPPQPLQILSEILPYGTLGVRYAAQMHAVGGVPPYTWTAENLPAGISMDAGTGIISGVPNTLGKYISVIKVTDSANSTVQGYVTFNPITRDEQAEIPFRTT